MDFQESGNLVAGEHLGQKVKNSNFVKYKIWSRKWRKKSEEADNLLLRIGWAARRKESGTVKQQWFHKPFCLQWYTKNHTISCFLNILLSIILKTKCSWFSCTYKNLVLCLNGFLRYYNFKNPAIWSVESMLGDNSKTASL